MSSDKIVASLVIEVLGRPPEHIEETLREIIKKIGEEDGVSILESKINSSVEIQNQKGMFTTFAEIEVETKDLTTLVILMFKYMPAHIEIISPEALTLTNNGWNDIFNELVRRLHGYDEVAGVLQMEKKILEDKLRHVLANTPSVKGDKEEEIKEKSKGKKRR